MPSSINEEYWEALDKLVSESHVIIDRPKGSAHPDFPTTIYPVNYGYLKGTKSMDGSGIDVWVGTASSRTVGAVMCTIDILKKDSEVKILIGCTANEKALIYDFHNVGSMRGLLITRKNERTELKIKTQVERR